MTSLGMQRSMTEQSVLCYAAKMPFVVAHVDDFLCVGPEENLMWLFGGRSEMLETTKKITEG